jgi:hypothetical protein
VAGQSDTEGTFVTWNMPESGHIRQQRSQLFSGPPIGFGHILHSRQILYTHGVNNYRDLTAVFSTTWDRAGCDINVGRAYNHNRSSFRRCLFNSG